MQKVVHIFAKPLQTLRIQAGGDATAILSRT